MRLLPFLAVACLAATLSAQNPKKSTPEERQQWADALHKFEADPTSDAALADAAQATIGFLLWMT